MLRFLYKSYNIIFLLVVFGVFKDTPLYLIDKFLIVIGAFISCFWITYRYLANRNIFYKFSKYYLIVLFTLCFVSIYLAKAHYAQAYLDSLTANIDYASLLIIIFYACAFKSKLLRVQDIVGTFKWFILLNVILLFVFRNAANQQVTSLTGQHVVVLRTQYFPKEFIRLGVIYLFALFLTKKKYIYILLSGGLLLYPNLLLYFERGYFAVTVMLMILTVFLIRKSQRLFRTMVLSALTFVIFLIIAINAAGPVADTILTKYSDIVSGVTNGSSVDPSVQYRIQELGAAAKLIIKNPYVGSGRLNITTTETVLGMDYYPSDLGIIGIWSAYGIPGVILYFVILSFSIAAFYKTIKNANQFSYVTICLAMYTLALAIESLQTAQVLITPAEWSFMYIFYLYSRNTDIATHKINEKLELADMNAEEIPFEEINNLI